MIQNYLVLNSGYLSRALEEHYLVQVEEDLLRKSIIVELGKSLEVPVRIVPRASEHQPLEVGQVEEDLRFSLQPSCDKK